MFEDFTELMNTFSSKSYDPLDLNNLVGDSLCINILMYLCVSISTYVFLSHLQEFAKDFADFKAEITDMEQRLGLIVCQAFDECCNCESAFKVKSIFTCYISCMFHPDTYTTSFIHKSVHSH